jgi:cellulose synthase/poly-beta-1,6-N-acetylglucosamine synthase-like glycosyltransferase
MSATTLVLFAGVAVSLLLLSYIYALYPVALLLASRFVLTSATSHSDRSDDELPSVSLIIAAYNEEAVIGRKIENSLALEYPSDKLEIVVFSDASSDRTDEIVESYADRGVRLERIQGRVGKTECQNRVAAMVDADVLVFSDANCMYEPDAIRKLVSRFDDDVGCVVGELRHTRTEDDVVGESIYWRYNRLVKRLESKISSVVKGNGAIYAVRADRYVPLPADSMSDFAGPLAIRKRGYAVQYAHDAVAREPTAGSVDAERSRKIRMVTRSWHTLRRHLELLNPLRFGIYSVQFFTDTILWWCSPLLFLGLFTSAALLWLQTGHVLFSLVVGGYAMLIALGLVGRYLERNRTEAPSVFHISHYFLVGNYSLVMGALNFLRGRTIVTWETANE